MHTSRANFNKGYSLLELAVVLSISTILLVGMVSWLVSLGSVAQAGISEIGNNEVVLAEAQISDDITNMTWCSQESVTMSRVHHVNLADMSIYSLDNGARSRISWRYNPLLQTLERSVVAVDSNCVSSIEDSWAIWVRNVENATFKVGRTDSSDSTTSGECFNAYASRCMPTSLKVEILITDDVGGSISVYDLR